MDNVTFSPDGRQVLIGGGGILHLYDVGTGKWLRTFEGECCVMGVAFSPDGKQVLAGGTDYAAHLWDTETGKMLRTYQGHGWVDSVAFSAEGKQVLTGWWDKTACLWETETGKLLQTCQGHLAWVLSAANSPDGRFIATGSSDSTTRLWDATSGRELCTLLSFEDGGWAVTDPSGRYDTPHGEDIAGLHWVIGDKPLALSRLKDYCYDPGLLAKITGASKESLRSLPSPAELQRLPSLAK